MRVVLKSILCERTGGAERTEEPYLRIYYSDRGNEVTTWGPVHMVDGQTVPINRTFDCTPDYGVNLWLLESDTAGVGMHTVDDESIDWFYITPDHPRGSFNVYLPHYEGIVGQRRSYAIFYDMMEDERDRLDKGWCLQLVSLTCNDAQEYEDELFMNVNGERVMGPRYMKTGDTTALDSLRPIPIDRAATIELWEQDATTASRNDLLGAFTLQITDDFNLHEVHSQTFSWRADAMRDATYTLNYRVRQREWTPFGLDSDIGFPGKKRKVRRYNC